MEIHHAFLENDGKFNRSFMADAFAQRDVLELTPVLNLLLSTGVTLWEYKKLKHHLTEFTNLAQICINCRDLAYRLMVLV